MNNPKLISLYQLYIDNTCTAEELQELSMLLQNQDNEEDFKRLLDTSWDEVSTHQLTDISQSKASQIYLSIVQSQSKKQQKQNYKLWIGIAASLILIFSVTLSFYKQVPGKIPAIAKATKKGLAEDIKPGSEKAILTLGNGRTVMLGNLRNGQAGPEVHKAKDGQLVAAAEDSLPGSETQQNTIAIPLAGQYHLTLPDGTLVYLNSASTLSYPTKFAGNARVVTLKGEAYFEVTKNPKMPFRVNVNGEQQIEVLGTHFNVKAYADEHLISATLLEGSVKVKSRNQQLLLKPGQAAINNMENPIQVKPADLEEVMAWKNGMFIFNNESITEIMKKISRWYDVEVVFKGNMENINFTGNYSRSKSLSSLLMNIELMEKVRFSVEERRITVIEK